MRICHDIPHTYVCIYECKYVCINVKMHTKVAELYSGTKKRKVE